MPRKKQPYRGYRDIFGGDPLAEVPIILDDGTSVEFPKGWTKQDVLTWRQYCGLLPRDSQSKQG